MALSLVLEPPPATPASERDFREELDRLIDDWIAAAGADQVAMRIEGAASRVARRAHALRKQSRTA